jgi:hypothetical protein
VLKVIPVLKVTLDRQETQDLRVLKVIQEAKGQLAHKDLKVHKELKVQRVLKVILDQQETQDQ